MEITKRIIYLLHRRVRQELDVQELTELNAWSDRHSAFQQLLDEVSDEKNLTSALQAFDHVYGSDPAASIARMETRIARGVQEVSREPSAPARSRRLRRRLPYAAAILIAATAATWIFYGDRIKPTAEIVDLNKEDISPGSNRATLTLEDGRTIDLSEEQTGIIASDRVTYLDGSYVVEERKKIKEQRQDGSLGRLNGDPTNYYVLTTPKGGTYQLTLADGSKVWLNAASKLKYPSRFSGNERIVELEGEGYFKIAKDMKRPFRVRSKGQEVKVLGTEFNISAYADETETKTTLVGGEVKVSNLKSQISDLLTPGKQAVVAGSATHISTVNTDVYTAWKDGFFYFDRLPTRAALTQLARWYDLELIYEGKPATVNMFAYIERDKPLSAVLRSLEKSGLKFQVTQSGKQKQLIVLGES